MTTSLSFQQDELLRNVRNHPQAAGRYDWPTLFELGADCQVDVLEQALADLSGRHDVLRMTANGNGVRVGEPGPPPPLLDVPVAGSLQELCQELIGRRLTPEQLFAGAPLYRSSVHVIDGVRYLALGCHHFITDGWSDGIFFHDLAEIYRARLRGTEPELPELPMSYGDFAAWQRDLWDKVSPEVVPHWAGAFKDYPRELHWPSATSEVPGESLDNGVAGLTLDEAERRHIAALAKSYRVTPFILLLAVTGIALCEVLGRSDLLLGSTTANREQPFKQHMMGLFANTRFTRVRCEPGAELRKVVAMVRKSWLDDDQDPDIYSDNLLEAIKRPGLVYCNLRPAARSVAGQQVVKGIANRIVPMTTELVPVRDWRDAGVMWLPLRDKSYHVEVLHRLSRVDSATATAVLAGIRALLRPES